MALVSWFPLNGDIMDRINGYVLKNGSAATFVENDKFGKSLAATAACTGFVYPAKTNAEIFNSDFCSIAFWIYVPVEAADSNPNNMIIFGNDSIGPSTPYYTRKYSLFQYPTCNDLHLSWYNTDSSSMYAGFVLTGVLPSYKWTHVCLTYDGTKGVYCYINGELKWFTARTASQESPDWASESYAFWQYRNRYLSDVRVYNHCLSVKEVKELARGLILKYSFNGLTAASTDTNPPVSDTTIFDESGMSNNGKTRGTIYKTSDSIRAATHWVGSCTNAVYIQNNFVPLQTFTYSAWFKSTNSGSAAYEYIMGNGRDYGTGCGSSLCIIHSSGAMCFQLGNGTTQLWIYSTTSVADGNWHQVAATYDGTTAVLYIDGIQQSTGTLAGPLSWSNVDNDTTGKTFVIGKMCYGYTSTSTYFPFTGDLSDVRVYNTCFSASDVLDLYQTRKSISRSGELFVNSINEASGNTLGITAGGEQKAIRFNEIITLSDGSMWLQLMHQDLQGLTDGSTWFSVGGAAVRNSNAYLNEDLWSCFPLINTCDHGDNYEILVIEQEGEEGSKFVRHRWIQSVNPYEATFDTTLHANITAVENISSTYGGMYPGGENNAWYFNNSVNGNWFGCGLISSTWGGGYMPAYNSSTVKYIQNVYIRVYSTRYSERKATFFESKSGLVIAKEIKEIQ